MNKKYTFTMVVVKPTGKGGKPLNPKPIKPKPLNKSEGGMSNKPKKPKIIQLMPQGVFYKGKAKDYPGIKELIKNKNKKSQGGQIMTKNKIKTLVNHPMDHPDVIAYAKKRKKEREEIKEEYPILSKLIAPRGDDKKRAKGFLDYVQTEGAKKRTATEGSFAKGGLTGGQRKLDKNKDGKISSEDFKLIRREKPEIKPLKAREGKMVKTPDGKKEEDKYSKYVRSIELPDAKDIRKVVKKKAMGGEMKQGYGAARQSGMGLQDENLQPGKSMDYYKDLI
jgi:hypothetical protein